jgi:hypothetical protein
MVTKTLFRITGPLSLTSFAAAANRGVVQLEA